MKLKDTQYCVAGAFYDFIFCIFPALKVVWLLKSTRKVWIRGLRSSAFIAAASSQRYGFG